MSRAARKARDPDLLAGFRGGAMMANRLVWVQSVIAGHRENRDDDYVSALSRL
jgi:hypothetical protein